MLCGENAISDPDPEIPNPSTDQMLGHYCYSLVFTAIKAARHPQGT